MFRYRQNSRALWEIGVGEHDDDVRFLTGSRKMAVSRMRNEKICNFALTCGRIAKIAVQFSHGLVNSAIGHIPCSTERISCLFMHSSVMLCIHFYEYGTDILGLQQ